MMCYLAKFHMGTILQTIICAHFTADCEILNRHSVPKQSGGLVVILAPTWTSLPHLQPPKPSCSKVRPPGYPK